MLELLSALAGLGCGILCGLIPGLHPNNIIPISLSLTLSFGLSPHLAIIFLSCAAVSNTFVAYIPSTFLGVPEEGTALSVLPAHRMVREGKGFYSLQLTTAGCLLGILFGLLLLPLFLLATKTVYDTIKSFVPLILILIGTCMIFLETSNRKRCWALLIFLTSGIFGIACLSGALCPSDAALVPVFAGLFGLSNLLISLQGSGKIPRQDTSSHPLNISPRVLCVGGLIGSFMGMLPAIGPAQTTVIAQIATKSRTEEDFLLCVSEVNILKIFFSFVFLYLLGKARTGIAAAIKEIHQPNSRMLILTISASLFAAGMASIVTLWIGKRFCQFISRVPYRAVVLAISLWVAGLSLWSCGLMGIPILITATAIGILPAKVGVKRSHCMGVLMVPVILSGM